HFPLGAHADVEGAFEKLAGGVEVAQVYLDCRQVGKPLEKVGSSHTLFDRDRALQQRLPLSRSSQVLQGDTDLAQGLRESGILPYGFADSGASLRQRKGLLVVPPSNLHAREPVETLRDLGVLLSEELLAQAQRPLQQRFGLV